MRRALVEASIFAAATCLPLLCSPGQSFASEPQPYVIAGIGPDTAMQAPATQAPATQASAPVASTSYGGGLIELLMTGREPGSSQALYNHPIQTTTPSRARIRQAYYAPIASPAPAQTAVESIYRRQEVAYDGPQKAGTIVVDTRHKFLFLVLGDGRAMRYGVGVGRPGFEWAGVQIVSRKAEWPAWTPPAQMRLRIPNLPVRMAGGPNNPLGARALYLGSSLYRIHGTNQPQTIGENMSSGCIRMMNEDVEDLYQRVGVGAKVVVI